MLDAAGSPHRRVNRAVGHSLPDDLTVTAARSAVKKLRSQAERFQKLPQLGGPVLAEFRYGLDRQVE
jgi:hypothetical protein